jgi:hypothetical protein
MQFVRDRKQYLFFNLCAQKLPKHHRNSLQIAAIDSKIGAFNPSLHEFLRVYRNQKFRMFSTIYLNTYNFI